MGLFQEAVVGGIARTQPQVVGQQIRRRIFMDISVVIVAWNAKHYLELCLESLAEAPPRRREAILFVSLPPREIPQYLRTRWM